MQLGKHAKRMLEIGEVMDELEELEFFTDEESSSFLMAKDGIIIEFGALSVFFDYIHDVCWVDYDNPNWQQELLTMVKELINEI